MNDYNPLPSGARGSCAAPWKEAAAPLTDEQRAEQRAALERGRQAVAETEARYARHMASGARPVPGMAGYVAAPWGRGPYCPLEWLITGPEGWEVIAAAPTAEAAIEAIRAQEAFYAQDDDPE